MSAEAQVEPLRLLHWNIHSWIDPARGRSNADAVIGLIREHEPDAVSLVEVDETWSEPSTLAQVADSCGYTAIFIPTFEYGTDGPEGGFGNAILTRLPVQAVEQRQLTWPSTVYDGTEPSEPRSVLLVTVRTTIGDDLGIGSTHLPHGDGTARERALGRLSALLGSLRIPWVVCGDFNAPASAWVGSASPFSAAPSGAHPTYPTYPTEQPTESIDYAVASPGISLDADVLAVSGSDHLPVHVEARLSGPD